LARLLNRLPGGDIVVMEMAFLMQVFGQRCCAGYEQVAVMVLANPW